ncbi:MAG TPA: MgtC/SapB family protein [Candidatus Limnocylindrales bacterium]|nr:MgtC/SapB family protein [Candidatus Limnocylindrales bacterium]
MNELPLEQQALIVAQVILAGILGLIIGFDRERKHRDAGIRTMTLVAMGSCLFTALSITAFPGSDASRVASQIIPGMGFLGAGAIIKEGRNVQGLTTAATMWVTAAIGMSVGTGNWFVAIAVTVAIWFVLVVLQRVKRTLPLINAAGDASLPD